MEDQMNRLHNNYFSLVSNMYTEQRGQKEMINYTPLYKPRVLLVDQR